MVMFEKHFHLRKDGERQRRSLIVLSRAEAEPGGQSAVVLREQSNGGVDEQAIRLVASLKASSLEKKLLFGETSQPRQ